MAVLTNKTFEHGGKEGTEELVSLFLIGGNTIADPAQFRTGTISSAYSVPPCFKVCKSGENV